MARLILTRGDQSFAVEVKDGTYIIGRDASADIVIPDHTVSGRHVEVRINGSSCVIRDLGSSNGTLLNGMRINASQHISPSDEIQLGAARLIVEVGPGGPAAGPTARMPAAASPSEAAAQFLHGTGGVAEAPMAAHVAKRTLRWNVALWLAGASAIAAFVFLMLFIEWYSQAEMTRAQVASRFSALAAQYMHLLRQSPIPPLPPPVVDQWTGEPRLILDREGKILYPPQPAAEGGWPSPVIDPSTGKLREQAKSGLCRLKLANAAGPPIEASSYPVIYNGELVGFVVARPVAGYSNLSLIALMIVCAAAISMFVFYFAMRPIISDVSNDVHAMQEKLSAVAHGFVAELPRSARMPELTGLAVEVEHLVRSLDRGTASVQRAAAKGEQPYAALCAALVDAAFIPYCFIGTEFQLLSANREVAAIRELSTARPGVSIFESGLTTVQSKQIVRALTEARSQGEARAEVTLTRKGTAVPYIIHMRRMNDPAHGETIIGLLFQAAAG